MSKKNKLSERSEEEISKWLVESRKKHFAVKAELESHPLEAGQIVVTYTHNGHQWHSFSVLQGEIPQMIAALKKYHKT